jgi:putative ABC transport system permease protein
VVFMCGLPVVATLLAAAGVYVVLSFAVTRRTQEFGVRVALGASRREVLQLVLNQTVKLVDEGVLLTLPLTFGAIWLTGAELFGVTDTDPRTCLWAIGIIGAVAVLASTVPVWRAVRVDPSIALRRE